MNLSGKLYILKKIFKAIIFKQKSPLIALWDITYKCNSQCSYCPYHGQNVKELDTNQALVLIDKIASLGVKFIVLSGGEPLLRQDLPTIINTCKNKKMHVSINSNGSLIRARIKKINKINSIKLSLDGPKEINDFIRYQGSYDNVLDAVEACKKEGINVNLTTVISSYNIKYIPNMLDIAKELNVGVFFQPVKNGLFDNYDERIIGSMPAVDDYQNTITFLIQEKRKNNKYIKNSFSGLKHLHSWPNEKKIYCLASLISFGINPDGYIFICDWFKDCEKHLISKNTDFKKIFYDMRLPRSCNLCSTASFVDLNMLGQLKIDSIIEAWKRLHI